MRKQKRGKFHMRKSDELLTPKLARLFLMTGGNVQNKDIKSELRRETFELFSGSLCLILLLSCNLDSY